MSATTSLQDTARALDPSGWEARRAAAEGRLDAREVRALGPASDHEEEHALRLFLRVRPQPVATRTWSLALEVRRSDGRPTTSRVVGHTPLGRLEVDRALEHGGELPTITWPAPPEPVTVSASVLVDPAGVVVLRAPLVLPVALWADGATMFRHTLNLQLPDAETVVRNLRALGLAGGKLGA